MYQKVSTDLNFIGREEEVLSFWEKEEIFKKAQKAAEGRPEFTFYDGPPTANGKPHIGHILTRCIKDLFPRYKARRAGSGKAAAAGRQGADRAVWRRAVYPEVQGERLEI